MSLTQQPARSLNDRWSSGFLGRRLGWALGLLALCSMIYLFVFGARSTSDNLPGVTVPTRALSELTGLHHRTSAEERSSRLAARRASRRSSASNAPTLANRDRPPSDSPLLTSESFRVTNPPVKGSEFSIVLKVMTFNRKTALARCLQSLNDAQYGSAEGSVELEIWIDHYKYDSATFQADKKTLAEESQKQLEVMEVVDHFEWKHGKMRAFYHAQNQGIQGQWLGTWYPTSRNEYAFYIEDDVVVSPLFYVWLQKVIEHYRYEPGNYDPNIWGMSLQRNPVSHTGIDQMEHKVWTQPEPLYLYPMAGTWGQLVFPEHWREFRSFWERRRYDPEKKPYLAGMITDVWYRKLGETIWTPYIIRYAFARGYYNLYTNFPDNMALSVSYRDAGTNYAVTRGPDAKLIMSKSKIAPRFWDFPAVHDIPRYNFCLTKLPPFTFSTNYEDLKENIGVIGHENTVALIPVNQACRDLVNNFLCSIQSYTVPNILFYVGGDLEFGAELYHRGYHVYADSSLADVDIASPGSGHSSLQHPRLVLGRAQLVDQLLKMGYNVMLNDLTFLWLKNPLPDLQSSARKEGVDMLVLGSDVSIQADIMFLCPSTRVLAFWEELKTVYESSALKNGEFGADLHNTDTEQSDQLHTILNSHRSAGLTWSHMDPVKYISDISARKHQTGTVFAVHNGPRPSMGKLRLRNLWFLDSDDLGCLAVDCPRQA